MSRFTADVFQNEFLPHDASEVNAIVTVTSAGGAGAAPPPAAEIIIVDSSGSMAVPRQSMRAAKRATAVAVEAIRDGVRFAVIAGTDTARQIYPESGRLATAS